MNFGKIKIMLICIGLWPLLKLTGLVRSPAKDHVLINKSSINSVISHSRNMANDASSIDRFILSNGKNQNSKKINGLWLLVRSHAFQLDSGKETELSIKGKENHFYIKLWENLIVRMTRMSEDTESKSEYYISSLSDKNISVFRQVSNRAIWFYHLKLVELDIENPVVKAHSPEMVVADKNKNREMTLTLSEAYDRNLSKIINKDNPDYSIRGVIELLAGKITNVFADVNGFELKPTSLSKGVGSVYIYETDNGEGGKAQANFINSHEFNFYFMSGPYHGYTLIFSRELSDDELYKKENLRLRLQNQQILRGNNEFNRVDEDPILTQEEAVKLQEEAVAQRIKLASRSQNLQVREPANFFSKGEGETINTLLVAHKNGEVLGDEDQDLMDEYSQEIKDQGGFDFSNPF